MTKAWKLTTNWLFEIQADKFKDVYYNFLHILIGAHGFTLSIFEIKIEAHWRCDHPRVALEAMSPWGHYFGLTLYDKRHRSMS